MGCYCQGEFLGIIMKTFKHEYKPGVLVLHPEITDDKPATFKCIKQPTRFQGRNDKISLQYMIGNLYFNIKHTLTSHYLSNTKIITQFIIQGTHQRTPVKSSRNNQAARSYGKK